jgi:hypothetical protein
MEEYNMYTKKIAILFLAVSVITQAQQTHMFNADEIVFLDEFKGIAQFKNEGLVITSLNTKASWLDEYKDVDMQLNDVIIYTNGKQVKSLNDFKEIYSNAAPGAEIKLGIRRGEEMFIASFKRMDSSKIKRKIITLDGSSKEKMKNIEMKGDKLFIDGKEIDPDSLETAGVQVKKIKK